MSRLKILSSKWLDEYKKKQHITLRKHFNKLSAKPFSFGYAIIQSVVYSSQIEGNAFDIDTYVKFNDSGMNTGTRSFQEIKCLEKAYHYAKDHVLNHKNFFKCHEILSSYELIEETYRGKYRDKDVFIRNSATGEIVFKGADSKIVSDQMDLLFNDIQILRKRSLTMSEVFYFASMIHLIFVAIHPFADGNGRSARLLEKWFLVEKLGADSWYINSEKLYKERLHQYHKALALQGESYDNLKLDNFYSFAKMLPMALRKK